MIYTVITSLLSRRKVRHRKKIKWLVLDHPAVALQCTLSLEHEIRKVDKQSGSFLLTLKSFPKFCFMGHLDFTIISYFSSRTTYDEVFLRPRWWLTPRDKLASLWRPGVCSTRAWMSLWRNSVHGINIYNPAEFKEGGLSFTDVNGPHPINWRPLRAKVKFSWGKKEFCLQTVTQKFFPSFQPADLPYKFQACSPTVV